MKKLSLIFIIIFSISAYNDIKAFDTTAAKYMPLQLGNVWVYNASRILGGGIMHCEYKERFSITGISIFNNKIYYRLRKDIIELSGNSGGCVNSYVDSRLFRDSLIRIDSFSANLYGTDSCIIDSLASQRGDIIYLCLWPNTENCDTGTVVVFGNNILAKAFLNVGTEWAFQMIYATGIGLLRYSYSYPGPSNEYIILQGCVINGVVHGDTTLIVGVNQVSTEIPKRFSLSQNYPNPFNPSTKIKFSIPVAGTSTQTVHLKICDMLGREVTTLVNENLKPGEYEAEWNASDFASGVYFYQLTISNEQATIFSQTKKLVVIK